MTNIVMSYNNPSAYLEIILGPMYSGKTSRLVEIYKQCKFCDIPVVVINHSIDTRYESGEIEDVLSTHDKVKIPCIKTNCLLDLYADTSINDAVQFSDVILVNEGQFFSDLVAFVECMLTENKKIYVCGLDGDFERNKFGEILDLIPLCDKVTKLTSLCSICKNGVLGIFSKRLTKEKEQTVVGSDNYIPVCRNCYAK
jgi:thymidine kinase